MTTEQFAADLSELRLVGEVDLPMLAYTYADANTNVAGTAAQDAAGFEARGGGGWDAAGAHWRPLRDLFQNILGRTSTTLSETGQVVVHIVNAYAATDENAARIISDAWRDGPPGGPTERKPPDPPPVVLK